MKSSPTVLQDASDDDIFGPPRTYTSSYYSSTRQRPSMISAKYRQKEERRKVLKISVNKLRKIEDPENSLCRSVLINNTMKRLQRESKEEKLNQCQQIKVKSVVEFAKLEPDTDLVEQKKFGEFANFNDDLVPQDIKKPDDILPNDLITATPAPPTIAQRKRSIDEVEDCDVQDVLSQFYMPPTPRMLTSIDDDEDLLPEIRRKYDLEREEIKVAVLESTREEVREKRLSDDYIPEMKRTKYEEESKHPVPQVTQVTQITQIAQIAQVTVPVTTASSFSCGHSSIFNDLQNNVFHSLVASLET